MSNDSLPIAHCPLPIAIFYRLAIFTPPFVVRTRTSGPPDELIPALRETLRSVDRTVPIEDVASMESRLYDTLAQPRQWAALLGLFAATALVLAAIGVYGMLSYTVGAQRRELGLHLALGAQPRTLARSVVLSGLKLALVGSVIGLVVAVAAGRALTHNLYHVDPNDPRTLAEAIAQCTLQGVIDLPLTGPNELLECANKLLNP